MAVTIKVNGMVNTLVHKGSNGFSVATIPDICKTPTPGSPVPIPYPNISQTTTLAKGTKTVKADGGNMIAVKGSEFSLSNGDNPGTMGGVKSSTFMKESTWILYSFDVKMDGRNACRLTDKKFQNHQNTVDLAGETQAALYPMQAPEILIICKVICECDKTPGTGATGQNLKQTCVSSKLQAMDDAAGNKSTIKPEINYNMTTSPPSPIMSRTNPLRGTSWLPNRVQEIPNFKPNTGMVRRPDAVIVNDVSRPPTQGNLRGVVEIKFDEPRDAEQIRAYQRIAGKSPVIELSPEKCDCNQPKPKPEPKPITIPEPSPVEVVLLSLALIALAADDVTGAGAADDVAIPAILARLAMAF
jgi:hypothetical protein